MDGHARSGLIRSPPVTSGPRARPARVNAGNHRGRPGLQGPASCRLCRTGMVRTLPGLEAVPCRVLAPRRRPIHARPGPGNAPTSRARRPRTCFVVRDGIDDKQRRPGDHATGPRPAPVRSLPPWVTRFVRCPRGAPPDLHDPMRDHARSARIRSPPVTSVPRGATAGRRPSASKVKEFTSTRTPKPLEKCHRRRRISELLSQPAAPAARSWVGRVRVVGAADVIDALGAWQKRPLRRIPSPGQQRGGSFGSRLDLYPRPHDRRPPD